MKSKYRPQNPLFIHGQVVNSGSNFCQTPCGNPLCRRLIEAKLGMPLRLCEFCFKEVQDQRKQKNE